ncbi:MAG: DUF4346 domain-containing protein [Deltaproteobacteria bacterium]|nr:DUF4346 domain-containing protein [Deltaproteobacteria bacterium]MBW2068825.1 DUF4346 domain-containing protein [Deltaproteobacteria bacterium]
MEFIPLYCRDQLKVLNSNGTVGIITLWSGVEYVIKRLKGAGIDLNPERTPVAVVGTLYGNGLRELLRNLLYNPQIDFLILCGRNRSGSAEQLIAFFEKGIEPVQNSSVQYEPLPDGSKPGVARIIGTSRILDDLVRPEMFRKPLKVVFAGEAQDDKAIYFVRKLLEEYKPENSSLPPRLRVPLPSMRVTWYPSNPRMHSIWAKDPLTAWKDLIHTLYHFGRPVRLKKGPRRELQNVKVVVEDPAPVDPEELSKYGFSVETMKKYQREFLSELLPEDTTYTYGNRIRAHFGFDQIEKVTKRLRKDSEDRKSYVVLWDPRRDLSETASGRPCLVSIFFRKFEEKLTLTATFRTHNALDAWLVNFYGLMALRDLVASNTDLPGGAITIISHSISIDEMEIDRAAIIAGEKEFRYRLDPMGYFRISIDNGEIIVEYRADDVTLKTYRGKKAARLQHEIARDGVVSEISHAIYLGRQLERAERCLKDGTPFVQD